MKIEREDYLYIILVALIAFSAALSMAGCSGKQFNGHLFVNIDSSRAFDVKAAALASLDQLADCLPALPPVVIITEFDLNSTNTRNTVICARGEVNGVRIFLDNREHLYGSFKVCSTLEDTIAHEVLHLVGMTHDDKEEQKYFDATLKRCGFFGG